MTHIEALYGRTPPSIWSYTSSDTRVDNKFSYY